MVKPRETATPSLVSGNAYVLGLTTVTPSPDTMRMRAPSAQGVGVIVGVLVGVLVGVRVGVFVGVGVRVGVFVGVGGGGVGGGVGVGSEAHEGKRKLPMRV